RGGAVGVAGVPATVAPRRFRDRSHLAGVPRRLRLSLGAAGARAAQPGGGEPRVGGADGLVRPGGPGRRPSARAAALGPAAVLTATALCIKLVSEYFYPFEDCRKK